MKTKWNGGRPVKWNNEARTRYLFREINDQRGRSFDPDADREVHENCERACQDVLAAVLAKKSNTNGANK